MFLLSNYFWYIVTLFAGLNDQPSSGHQHLEQDDPIPLQEEKILEDEPSSEECRKEGFESSDTERDITVHKNDTMTTDNEEQKRDNIQHTCSEEFWVFVKCSDVLN